MAIRWDKFTLKSQEAIQKASSLANENGQPEVVPMHLLTALLEDKEGIIVPLLQKVGHPHRAVAFERPSGRRRAAQGQRRGLRAGPLHDHAAVVERCLERGA